MSSAAPPRLRSVVVRGIGLAGAGNLLTQAITFATYIMLARLLTPEDFGEFAAGSILVGLGTLFAESGMLSAVVQRRDRLDEAASTAFVATIASGLLLAATALAAAPLVGLYFDSREITLVAAAMSGYIALRQTTVVPNALLQRRFSFLRRMVVEPLSILAFAVSAVAGATAGYGVWSLVLATYVAIATQVGLSWGLVRWRPRLRLASFAVWRELIGFGRHITGGELVRHAAPQAAAALVGRFVGTSSLGQYHYATRVAERPLAMIVDGVSYVLFPAFARIAEDEARFRRAVLRALRSLTVVAYPASFILLPLGAPVAVTVFGEDWGGAGNALAAMCGVTAGRSLVSLGAHSAAAAGRPGVVFRIHLLGGILLLASTAVLLPFGLRGVGAALSLGALGTGAYALWRVADVIGAERSVVFGLTWAPLSAALVMSLGILLLERGVVDAASHEPGWSVALLAGEALAGLVVYAAVLCTLSPKTARDLAAGGRAIVRHITALVIARQSTARPEQ